MAMIFHIHVHSINNNNIFFFSLWFSLHLLYGWYLKYQACEIRQGSMETREHTQIYLYINMNIVINELTVARTIDSNTIEKKKRVVHQKGEKYIGATDCMSRYPDRYGHAIYISFLCEECPKQKNGERKDALVTALRIVGSCVSRWLLLLYIYLLCRIVLMYYI